MSRHCKKKSEPASPSLYNMTVLCSHFLPQKQKNQIKREFDERMADKAAASLASPLKRSPDGLRNGGEPRHKTRCYSPAPTLPLGSPLGSPMAGDELC